MRVIRVRLAEYLRMRGIRITDLSNMAGVSRQNLSRFCNNHFNRIDYNTVHAIVNALGCELSDVFELVEFDEQALGTEPDTKNDEAGGSGDE